ncbi:uncharacterized protein [Haliotis asinina]|uniref:uncharacterized protein n=1 Tax=Haliotis asinina TaxID=109174 RepID=UPI003532202B
MSSPETFESPRMSLLPGVIEEDGVTLLKWEEGSQSTKVSRVSTRMYSSSGRRSDGTRQIAMVKSRKKETRRYKESSDIESAECNAKISEFAKMRSKLADEVGCDEDELGDWLELSKHARKLQQAIHTADVQIQRQSGLFDEKGIETDQKNNEGEFKSQSKLWTTEPHDREKISEKASLVDIDQQNMPHKQDTELGVDSNLGMDVPSMSKARHLQQHKLRADKLPELSEDDNEECDAEVASMDLEKCEEFEKSLMGLTDEEEELRMFEELEARLAQDEKRDDKPEKGESGIPDSHGDNQTTSKGESDTSVRQEESYNVKYAPDVGGEGEDLIISQNTDKAKAGTNTETTTIVEQVSDIVGHSEGSPERSYKENKPVCQSPEGLQIVGISGSSVADSEHRNLLHTKMHSANASAIVKDDNLLQNAAEDKQNEGEDGDANDANIATRVSPDEVFTDNSSKEVKDAFKDITGEDSGEDLHARLSRIDNTVYRSPEDVLPERPLLCDEHTRTASSSLRPSQSSAVDAQQNDLHPDHTSQSTSDPSSPERHKDESSMVLGEDAINATPVPICAVGDHGPSTVEHITAHPCSQDGTDVDNPSAGWLQYDQQSLDEDYKDAETDRPVSLKQSHFMLDLIPSSEIGTDVDAPARVGIEHTDEPSTTDEFETPPSGMSPCETPPRALSPCAPTPSESPPRRMSTPEADDIVKRRSPKGRVSPSKRFSEGANKQNKPSDVSQKTDSCVLS